MEEEKIDQVVVSLEQAVEVQKTGYLHYPPKLKLDILEEFTNQEKQAKLKQKEISERKLLEEVF